MLTTQSFQKLAQAEIPSPRQLISLLFNVLQPGIINSDEKEKLRVHFSAVLKYKLEILECHFSAAL